MKIAKTEKNWLLPTFYFEASTSTEMILNSINLIYLAIFFSLPSYFLSLSLFLPLSLSLSPQKPSPAAYSPIGNGLRFVKFKLHWPPLIWITLDQRKIDNDEFMIILTSKFVYWFGTIGHKPFDYNRRRIHYHWKFGTVNPYYLLKIWKKEVLLC